MQPPAARRKTGSTVSASKSVRNSRYGLPIRSLLVLAFLLPATPSKGPPLPQAETLKTQARALVRHATKDDLLKAAKKLQTAAKIDGPNAARDYLALGEIYMTLSWFPRAREKFKRAMVTDPDDIDLQCLALSDLADLESTLGHKTDSKENSDRAVAMADKGASQRVKARALESQAPARLYGHA